MPGWPSLHLLLFMRLGLLDGQTRAVSQETWYTWSLESVLAVAVMGEGLCGATSSYHTGDCIKQLFCISSFPSLANRLVSFKEKMKLDTLSELSRH